MTERKKATVLVGLAKWPCFNSYCIVLQKLFNISNITKLRAHCLQKFNHQFLFKLIMQKEKIFKYLSFPYCFWLIVLAGFYTVWHKYHSLNFFPLQINMYQNEVAIVFSFHKALPFTAVCIVWFHHMVIHTYCYMNICCSLLESVSYTLI